ncbi:MAG: hypothetical protein ACLFQO_18035 [Cyclobacteriaceae bacterium]
MVSCSEDPVEPTYSLAGKWKVTDITYEGTSTTSMAGMESSVNFTATGKSINILTEFTETPNKVTSGGSYEVLMKMNYGGTEMEMTVPGFPFIMTGDWQKNGDKIIVSHNGEEQEADILQLDDKALKIGFNQTVVTEESGVSMEIQTKGVFVYTKQ